MELNTLLLNKSKVFFDSKDKTRCNYMIVRVNPSKKLRGMERHVKNNSLQSYSPSSNNHISIEDIADWSGSNLCSGIEKGYIMEKIEENDYVIISAGLKKRSTRGKGYAKSLCGILLLKVYSDYLYITLICGKAWVGQKLINLTEDIAKSSNIYKIKLDSVDAPISFYLKNKFKFDRGEDTYKISDYEDEDKEVPKKISNPPPNTNEKGEKIDIGYIHSETHGNKKYHWMIIKKQGIKRWRLIKPGYIFLNKLKPDVVDYLKTRKPSLLTAEELKTRGGTKGEYIYGGMITTLTNVNTKRADGDGLAMTKVLEKPKTKKNNSNNNLKKNSRKLSHSKNTSI